MSQENTSEEPKKTGASSSSRDQSFLMSWVELVGSYVLDGCAKVHFYFSHFFRSIGGVKKAKSGEVVVQSSATGIEAIPILLLIGFLMGLVMAMQSAAQLRQFGATIFVADLVAVSITRELGPLLTGILVAGRSSSAFAAEIGTMKINDEVSALQTMGLNIHSYLFTPKIIAAILVLPLLTLLTDLMGLFGGYILSISTMNISSRAYIQQTLRALHFADVGTGLLKALVFGAIISIVGTVKGIQVRRGAPQVGKAARSSVVLAIVLIIITDAIFTAIFHAF